MSKFCLNPACDNPQNPEQNNFCHDCRANLAESTQSYKFESYRVIKLLGQGGFGRTYLAEFLRRYNEPRVIKTLLTSKHKQTQPKVKKLFAREAEQLYHLDHPQIPKLYEYFEKDNHLYLVQEFIEGMSLREEFEQQGTFPAPKIQTILAELLPVLVYIEEQNLLHLDIKPANIMRRRSDGVLMLIDFGAARVKTGTDPTILTSIYTPGYAAIEHMMGRPVKASDVYSLGVTCLRLLTGCFPVGTNDLIYNDEENYWCWKEYLQERKIKVNEHLAAILDKMVAQSLTERYRDAQAALEDLLNPSSPSLPSLSRVKSSPRFGWLTGVAAILTGVVGIGGYLLIKSPEKISRISKTTGVDYTRLEELLEARKFEKADRETSRAMLQAAGREKEGWLSKEDMNSFSCQDLRLIDQLWLHYSGGQFGFSIQKEIYESLGGTKESYVHLWQEFSTQVGWRRAGSEGGWITYSDLPFNLNAPRGQLPILIGLHFAPRGVHEMETTRRLRPLLVFWACEL